MATDNRADALEAKQALREWLLDEIRPSHVLECYAGIDGEMHRLAWHRADSCIGIDRRIRIGTDKRRRLVGDTLEMLASMDLRPFTIFDVDAYGSPWETLIAIGEARTFGARFGVALTDGSQARTKFGMLPESMAELLGRGTKAFVYDGVEQLRDFHRRCLARWCALHELRVVDARWYTSLAGAQGSLAMIYSAAVIEPAVRS